MPYELVEVYVGPSDGPGEESFCLTVCTSAALAEVLSDQPVLVGRHGLFVAVRRPRCSRHHSTWLGAWMRANASRVEARGGGAPARRLQPRRALVRDGGADVRSSRISCH